MAYVKNTWVDRIVEFANRFTKSGETSTEVTLVASPGTITEAGSPISATRMNNIETGIETVDTILAAHETDYIDHIPYGGTTTGAANTYAIATPAISALVVGMAISVKINVASTGASTLNWDAKGAKPIKKADGTNMTNLKLNGIYTFRYDGVNFIVQGEGGEYGTAIAGDVITGKTIGTEAGIVSGTLALTGTAVVANVLAPQTFYGTDPKTKLTGTMVDRAGDTAALSSTVVGTTLKLRASDGFRDGTNDFVTITDADFIAPNIKNGANVLGVVGTYVTSESGSFTSNGTSQLVSGLQFTPTFVLVKTNHLNGAVSFDGYHWLIDGTAWSPRTRYHVNWPIGGPTPSGLNTYYSTDIITVSGNSFTVTELPYTGDSVGWFAMA